LQQTAAYQLQLRGDLNGEPGKVLINGQLNPGTFLIKQIVLASADGSKEFIRAVLPKELEIPATFVKDNNDPTELIKPDLSALSAELKARFETHRDEALRRLRTIEIAWKGHRFLSTTDLAAELRGHARLELAHIVVTAAQAELEAVAEFRLAARAKIKVGAATVERQYGIVCRISVDEKAKLSLDLDDLNLSLPDLDLPELDLSKRVKLPLLDINLTNIRKLAGAFTRFAKELDVAYTWNPTNAVLVVMLKDGAFLFAMMRPDLATEGEYDLSQYSNGTPPTGKLAELNATIKIGGLSLKAERVTFAIYKDGTEGEASGTLSATGTLTVDDGARTLGPLKIAWEGVEVTGQVTGIVESKMPDDASLRARVSFKRLLLCPIDDPTAVIAFRGIVEIDQSGTRIIELALAEPFPFVLLEKGAAALLRGAEKIIRFLGQLKPQAGQVGDLEKLLEVLGRIAAAVAGAAVFVARTVGEALATVADLLARALLKVAGALVELLKALAGLLKGANTSNLVVDIEVRIALEPLELRQVLITLPPVAAVDAKKQTMRAFGFKFELHEGWRAGVLLDFVNEPGAYLFAVRDTSSSVLATLSTNLWLQPAPSSPTAPVRDAGNEGKRPDDPLLAVSLVPKAAADDFLIVFVGLRRGKAVFLQRAKQNKSKLKINGTAVEVTVVEGPFVLTPLTDEVELTMAFDPKRIVPLLGLGEPASQPPGGGGTTFLDKLKNSLGQVITIKETRKPKKDGDKIVAGLVVEIQAAGVSTEAELGVELDLKTFEVKFTTATDGVFDLKSKRIEERALGLIWVIEPVDPDNKPVFRLTFAGGESGFELLKDNARMEIRFDGLSSDGEGVVFNVETFRIGRGGLDVTANVVDRAVRLNGLDVPFRFTAGQIKIGGGVLEEGMIAGRGQLPPALVGDANCSVVLNFEVRNGEIALKEGSLVELEKMGEPIVCHATRFTLTITHLELSFARDGGYHFYFLITGSLRFTPKPGEFEDGLLKHLADIEVTLEKAPLTNDPRVLLRHVQFQKELKPKKTFSLFNLFTFELRGFGFHPASPKFDGRPPAVSISGQIRFADLGDVMQPKIDFHELWIAPPKGDESLPRIKAEGLGVELQLAGAVKIRGAVLAVDPDTRTVEGGDFAPRGYNTYGFLGEGAVDIPGFCAIEASLGFLEVERQDDPGDRRLSFFLFLQANKLAVEIPTPIWTFYLREAGFGFGYRYTLAGIKDAENAKSTGQLVRILDDVSRRQGDLARFAAWKPDPEKDNFTLALRGAFQPFPAEKTFNEKREKTAVSPFFFDIVAALRSDFTFLMSARGWLGVNYHTFLENNDNFRERPGFRGYLYISVPRSELLLRAIADSKGFIGPNWPEVAEGMILRKAVQSVDWTTTLYIRPGLFHYEMGWPDQLVVRLVDEPNMRVVVRGGMIFRAAEEGLLFGYNIGADALIRFEGRAGGSIGVAVVAQLDARFVARVIAFLSSKFTGSLVYGLVSLDANLIFSVEAWMDVDLGFTSFTIRIGFSFSVQFSAAIELAISDKGVGGRVNARIAVQAFGCTLAVGVGFTFNSGQLDEARARVQRFLALSITAEEPDTPPVFAAKKADQAVDQAAKAGSAVHQAPVLPPVVARQDGLRPSITKSQYGRAIGPTDFWLVLRKSADPKIVYGFFVPKEPNDDVKGAFYSAPSRPVANGPIEIEHTIKVKEPLKDVEIWDPFQRKFVAFMDSTKVNARADAPIPVSAGEFTLAHFFDECFLADTEWRLDGNKPVRISSNWTEPHRRVYEFDDVPAETEDAENEIRSDFQQQHAAEAIRSPLDERAHQARSTLLTMFLDQFVTFSNSGTRPEDDKDAHVTDLGMVIRGPAEELKKIEKIVKGDTSSSNAGEVTILNPRDVWFETKDPILDDPRHKVTHDGIKLGWNFVFNDADSDRRKFLLDHYEIRRTVEGRDFAPHELRFKTGSTIGARSDDGMVRIRREKWKFTDSLAPDKSMPATLRRALLPAFGDAEGLEAAKAWIEAGLGEDVKMLYSVTPVDIAGARGLPRSFQVPIKRPQPLIRPAIGELRVVQTIDNVAVEGTTDTPKNVKVFLALNDRAFDDDSQPKIRVGDVEFAVERAYRIVVDPEDIEPAGHYGSDATTSRLRGPGAFVPQKTADELKFEIARDKTKKFNDASIKKEIEEVEPDADERKKLPRWARVEELKTDKGVRFMDALWSRGVSRVATRFLLETVLRFKPGSGATLEYVSKRVVLPVEHAVIGPKPENADAPVATLRPDALELAVPLALPALGDGQVDAESGFVRFRVPRPDARVGDLFDDPDNHGQALQRDAERRVLTTVRFAAVPDWAANTGGSPKALHASSIAGFDLYELDLDELAPLDVSGAATLGLDFTAWRRARRVARIEQLAAEDAQLVPAGNFDWQGWHAHYPSETQRVDIARTGERGGDSRPIRTAWYSDRETAPHFAERRPRLRFFPVVSESSISELMKEGAPSEVTASLVSPFGFALPPLQLHNVGIGPKEARVDLSKPFSPSAPFQKVDQKPFTAADLRSLLLCIGWGHLDRDQFKTARETWLKDPNAFSGLKLLLTGQSTFKRKNLAGVLEDVTKETGSTTIELELRSQIHPILEELLADLALENRETPTAPAVYRHFTVMPQPVTPMGAKDIAGFMANTAPEADPYGWKILQNLGEASTIRLHDPARGQFVSPAKLVERVDLAFQSALNRWKTAYEDNKPAFKLVIGQPFAEVFLRPGADRLAGPFDSVIENSLETEKASPLTVDDDGLAFVQLGFRPRPVVVWKYMRQELRWDENPDRQKIFDKPGKRLCSLALRISTAKATVDVLRARGGSVFELAKTPAFVTVPIPLSHKPSAQPDPEVELFFRADADHAAAADRPKIELLLEWEGDGDERFVEAVDILAATSPLVPVDDWQATEEPAGKRHPDPFAAFPPVSLNRWQAAYLGASVVANAALSFQALLTVASHAGFPLPDTAPDPTIVVAPLLAWGQRFLDHGAARTDVNQVKPFLAICGPTKATPWKLAADREGFLTLTFLHSDRWAHARAYAVKPISRYHELLTGIGLQVQVNAEPLIPAKNPTAAIGVAVAVSPRTERIEPPVVVGSRVVKSSIEIIVARHAEEGLANSNRALFAHLGVPASLIAFTRAYRTPRWPERLNAFIDGAALHAKQLPPREAELPARPTTIEQIDDTHLKDIVEQYPNLWKGADIWRIPTIPPHYRLVSLASQRAGIVVSDIATVVQDGMPRRELKGQDLLKGAKLTIERDAGADGKRIRLMLEHPLVSHADLTPMEADSWLRHGKEDDVCWWPDPDVMYLLSRRIGKPEKFDLEEEDADIKLTAFGESASDNNNPVVVRALGDRYDVVDQLQGGKKPIMVVTSVDGQNRSFKLRTSLGLQRMELIRKRLAKTQFGTLDQISKFNELAATFAAILTPHALTIDFLPLDSETADAKAYFERLKTKLPTELGKDIAEKLEKIEQPWFRKDLTAPARGLLAALDQWIKTTGQELIDKGTTDPVVLRKSAGFPFPFRLVSPWNRRVTLDKPLKNAEAAGAVVGTWTEVAEADLEKEPGTYLVAFDLAADAEIKTITDAAATVSPVGQKGELLYQLLAQRITDSGRSFWLKAVDQRTPIAGQTTPGVTETLVTPPEWFKDLKGEVQ